MHAFWHAQLRFSDLLSIAIPFLMQIVCIINEFIFFVPSRLMTLRQTGPRCTTRSSYGFPSSKQLPLRRWMAAKLFRYVFCVACWYFPFTNRPVKFTVPRVWCRCRFRKSQRIEIGETRTPASADAKRQRDNGECVSGKEGRPRSSKVFSWCWGSGS